MVSVIIPVYNAEAYLSQTIDSICSQTFRDIEIIIVNDGSTDNSLKIIEEAARRDARIRILSQENRGLSAARNVGIDSAIGEWIYFIDADDIARDDAIEKLLTIAIKEQTPVIIGGYFESEKEEWPKRKRNEEVKVLSGVEILKIGLYQKRRLNSACGVLYLSKILRKERFTENLMYEDLDLFPRICLAAERIAYYGAPLYFYRQHPQSFIHTFAPQRLDSLLVTDRILSLIRQSSPELEPAALDRQMSAAFNIILLLGKHRPKGGVPEHYKQYGTSYKEIGRYCFTLIRNNRRQSLFNPYVRLKNKLGALLSYGGYPFLSLFSRIV